MAFGDDVLPVDGAVPIAKQSKLKARAAIAHSLNASIKRALALYCAGLCGPSRGHPYCLDLYRSSYSGIASSLLRWGILFYSLYSTLLSTLNSLRIHTACVCMHAYM